MLIEFCSWTLLQRRIRLASFSNVGSDVLFFPSNDHNITLHDLHDLHDFQDLHDLHDQADHNPKPNDKPIPNHSQNRNLNSNHNQKLRPQNLPQPHHRCHPDPARLPHQQTPLLKAVPASATSSCAQFQARAPSCVWMKASCSQTYSSPDTALDQRGDLVESSQFTHCWTWGTQMFN